MEDEKKYRDNKTTIKKPIASRKDTIIKEMIDNKPSSQSILDPFYPTYQLTLLLAQVHDSTIPHLHSRPHTTLLQHFVLDLLMYPPPIPLQLRSQRSHQQPRTLDLHIFQQHQPFLLLYNPPTTNLHHP